MATTVQRLGIVILSCGWILPAWLSAVVVLDYLSAELHPAMLGRQPLNSFPFLTFGRDCLGVAAAWIAAAAIFWSWRATRPHQSEPTANR